VATTIIRHENGGTSIVECSYSSRRLPELFPQTILRIEGADGTIELLGGYRLRITAHDTVDEQPVEPDARAWTTKPWHVVQESVLSGTIRDSCGGVCARPRARVSQPSVADVIGQIEHAARHILATQPQSMAQLQEARIFFEIGMVREAARVAQPADIGRLQSALDLQSFHLGKHSSRFVAADMEFHTTIASITQNAVLEAVSRAMLHWLSMFHASLLLWKGHETVTLDEHRLILAAIGAHDEDRALLAPSAIYAMCEG
jgi:hypothetical protein